VQIALTKGEARSSDIRRVRLRWYLPPPPSDETVSSRCGDDKENSHNNLKVEPSFFAPLNSIHVALIEADTFGRSARLKPMSPARCKRENREAQIFRLNESSTPQAGVRSIEKLHNRESRPGSLTALVPKFFLLGAALYAFIHGPFVQAAMSFYP